ncbi:MAG TPA: glycoside hydrolase family 3 N-terminal domain-containing protein, partial [Chitinophagaceae bacterium]|nr:glycoside hydrolase family 3 N-terminal domain-containing protein [Chitinophagaceae bacterium]
MRLSAGLLKFSGILMALCLVFQGTKGQRNISFRDPNLPLNQRVEALLSSLTMKEKINLLGYRNRAIPSLGIPAYNWWNEGLHGVSRAGEATVFPQAIGMAASFDDSLLHQVADAISTEARAKHNLTAGKDPGMQYFGLTFWSPNINIFRDPRWGRGQETYGEDPYLTSRMAVAFIHGIQGADSLHLKAAACVKHFAVHSGPDALRHWFNALVDEKDLRETYLYAFHQSVQAGVASVMTAYNAVNGYPCSISPKLMGILKNDWHFSGYIVNDCGALDDIITGHHAETDPVKVAAEAIRAGIDLDCGNLLQSQVQKALDRHLLLPSEVDRSVAALLRTEFKLGFFDPPAADPYRNYGADSVDNAAHRALSLRMALESMVLLKNDGVLPLSKSKYHSMLVTGPTAASLDALLGSYHAESARMVDFVDGI